MNCTWIFTISYIRTSDIFIRVLSAFCSSLSLSTRLGVSFRQFAQLALLLFLLLLRLIRSTFFCFCFNYANIDHGLFRFLFLSPLSRSASSTRRNPFTLFIHNLFGLKIHKLIIVFVSFSFWHLVSVFLFLFFHFSLSGSSDASFHKRHCCVENALIAQKAPFTFRRLIKS